MLATSIEWFDSLPSTNGHLRDMLRADAHLRSGAVIAARVQTDGRGRRGRNWSTGAGRDLAFSILLRTAVPLDWLPSLPMAAALSVRHGLVGLGVPCTVKWPNDILSGQRKISGILSERVGEDSRRRQLMILGLGVNVNMTAPEAACIDRPATSLYIETGREHQVEDVLENILGAFASLFSAWEAGGFAALEGDVLRYSADIGKEVCVGEEGRQVSGTVIGYGPLGQLLLRDSEGGEHAVSLGEIL